MKEWTVIWLPPIDGGDLEDSKIILDKFKGVYIWKQIQRTRYPKNKRLRS